MIGKNSVFSKGAQSYVRNDYNTVREVSGSKMIGILCNIQGIQWWRTAGLEKNEEFGVQERGHEAYYEGPYLPF